jgi:hypothetical protein
MKIFILHLTDMHFNKAENWISDKVNSIKDALKSDYLNVDKSYFILSGDISNSGQKEEFAEATTFLKQIYIALRGVNPNVKIGMVNSPGNHDCNFKKDNQIRKVSLVKMDYKTIGVEDFSVIDSCISIQSDFWDYYRQFTTVPESKLFYQLKDSIGNKKICINCYNTAWMSRIDEISGSLFYPVKLIDNNLNNSDADLNISVFHHPIGWFSPTTETNNRREFQDHLERVSNILIYGHEHEDEQKKVTDIHLQKETIYISGETLQDHSKKNVSGFQTIIIDMDQQEAIITNYLWHETYYKQKKKENFKLIPSSVNHKSFKIKPDFFENINKISIPLQFEKVGNIRLSDIFIYPDLERIKNDYKKLDDFIDSEELLENEKLKDCIVEGENQSGKTSLLKMLFKRFYEKGYYPLYVDGAEINKPDVYNVLEKTFKSQYQDNLSFEQYLQLDNFKKVILIDNIQKAKFNIPTTIKFIKETKPLFDRMIVTIGSIYGYLSSLESEFPDTNLFTLKPLGYVKRNDLIELYHKIQESSFTSNDQMLLEKVKFSFSQVELVLGNKLMPSFPVFILSILQSLSYAKPIDLEQTSYGYCYQSLIHIALATKAKVINEEIDSYFNFLTEFSYALYEKQQKIFSDSEFSKFYDRYSSKFITPPIEKIKEALINSNIVVFEDESYRFSYKYIFYFLVAKKISDIIGAEKGKEIILQLCNNLQREKNANILVFIAHHSKDNFLIESATFSSMVTFEDIEAITLEKNDKFYQLIKGISEEVSSEVIDANKNPKEERKEDLLKKDHIERENDINKANANQNVEDEEDIEIQGQLITFYQAFRSIEIVGQIIKNRKGSLEKGTLITMITELYQTGFRSISYFGETLSDAKEAISEALLNNTEDGDTRPMIEKRINDYFQFITLQACLGVFTKMIHSVGNKDLRNLFDEVAEKIDTPAAKILTFSIKSYYDRMSVRELQKLAEEFQNNRVALKILKARVRAYIYNNYIDYKSKQRIASALKMDITPLRKQIS